MSGSRSDYTDVRVATWTAVVAVPRGGWMLKREQLELMVLTVIMRVSSAAMATHRLGL